ncbi:MAG: hypothetical protein SOT81_01565 [Treponema sp.]|nr:hypothetical protein [Treponema sp.]
MLRRGGAAREACYGTERSAVKQWRLLASTAEDRALFLALCNVCVSLAALGKVRPEKISAFFCGFAFFIVVFARFNVLIFVRGFLFLRLKSLVVFYFVCSICLQFYSFFLV